MYIKKFKQILFRDSIKQPNIIPMGETLYLLKETISYSWIGVHKNNTSFFFMTIKDHFNCDGRSCVKRDGIFRAAALMHDALYRAKGRNSKYLKLVINGRNNKHPSIRTDSSHIKLSRKACDQIYRDAYIKLFPGHKFKAMRDYFFLRLFGWKYFGKDMPG